MIRQTKKEEEEEQEEEGESDDEEEDLLERLSREEREFRCDHCGNRNLVSAAARPHPGAAGVSKKQQQLLLQQQLRHQVPDKPPRRRRRGQQQQQQQPGAPVGGGSRSGLFRSKSRARFLNLAEQQKLLRFRRFLLGAGVGYHELLARVGEIRAREEREREEAVDEDGLSCKRSNRRRGTQQQRHQHGTRR